MNAFWQVDNNGQMKNKHFLKTPVAMETAITTWQLHSFTKFIRKKKKKSCLALEELSRTHYSIKITNKNMSNIIMMFMLQIKIEGKHYLFDDLIILP